MRQTLMSNEAFSPEPSTPTTEASVRKTENLKMSIVERNLKRYTSAKEEESPA